MIRWFMDGSQGTTLAPPAPTRRLFLLLLFLPLGLLAVHAVSYLPFFADDSLISLRYAKRLIEGKGLTWTDGERVEGYSNLLWILLVSGLGRLGVDLIQAARILGLLFSALTLAAVLYGAREAMGRHPLLAVLPAAMLSVTGPFAAWAIGGLEQPLSAAALAWGLAWMLRARDPAANTPRRWAQAGFLFGLLCLTRPDGPLLTVAVAVGFALADRRSRVLRGCALFLGVAAILPLGQLLFRLGYYREWLPNTAYVKLTPSLPHLKSGLFYVLTGSAALLGLLAPAAAAAWSGLRRPSGRPRVLPLIVPILAWSVYLVTIGGDIFPARRHLIVVAVLSALLLAEGIRWWIAQDGGQIRRFGALLSLAGILLFFTQSLDPENLRARTERWEWDGKVVGLLLKKAFGEKKPLLAVDPAGCVPYFSDLPCIDMLGLNDHHLARSRPAGYQWGRIGHLVGDGAYVLKRRPDLVLFSQPAGGPPDYPTGKMMAADPDFHKIFREVTIDGDDPHSFRFRIYMMREGGRIGIQRLDDSSGRRVMIPGYLVGDNPAGVARLADGVLGMGLEEPARMDSLDLEPGAWCLEPRLDRGRARITLRRIGRSSIARVADDTLCLVLPGSGGSLGVEGSTSIDFEVEFLPENPRATLSPSGSSSDGSLVEVIVRETSSPR